MSNEQPYWKQSTDTQAFPRQASSTPPRGRSGISTVQGAAPRASENQQPSLLLDRFLAKSVTTNLAVLAGLGAVITFAVVLIVDRILGGISGVIPQSVSEIVITALVAGALGVGAGLLYLPVVSTGNESLFSIAILALGSAAVVAWVFFGGLLDGQWDTLTTLTAIICATAVAYAAPSRIESAQVPF